MSISITNLWEPGRACLQAKVQHDRTHAATDQKIEACGQRGFSRVSGALLGLAADAQQGFLDIVGRKQRQFAETGASDAASVSFHELKCGMTVWVGAELNLVEMANI